MKDLIGLDQSFHDALVRARTGLGVASEIVSKAQACGIDVGVKDGQRQELDQMLALLDQHFMGHLGKD